MSTEKERIRLEGYVIRALRLTRNIPAKAVRIHSLLLCSGKWPKVSLSQVQGAIDRLVARGALVQLRNSGSRFYRLPREGEINESADA